MQSLFKQLKIEKVYELLFPEKKKGLAVIWLYERIKNLSMKFLRRKIYIMLLKQ